MVQHSIPPVYDKNSKILILGSFPSVKSREVGFFYGHPQNRFWKLLARIFEKPVPTEISEKREFLLRNHVALWDVIASCEIKGSSDSSITNVAPNDLTGILSAVKIGQICCNGSTSYNLYRKYIFGQTGIEAVKLPSTSPANAAWSPDRLYEAWKGYFTDLK